MKIKDWLKQPLNILVTSKERWLLTIATGVFAIIFMNLYLPFNISQWHEGINIPQFLIISSYGIVGMIILMVSQFLVRPLLKFNSFTYRSFIIWCILEMLALSTGMFLVYGDKSQTGFGLVQAYFITMKYTILVIAIPYSVTIYYLLNRFKNKTRVSPEKSLVKIQDENKNVKLAIKLERILYIKNADNYVEVFYEENSSIRKELIRTSLKLLENQLRQYRILRCHRSFMVNLANIAFTKKRKNGLFLKIKAAGTPELPVSKNYSAALMKAIY